MIIYKATQVNEIGRVCETKVSTWKDRKDTTHYTVLISMPKNGSTEYKDSPVFDWTDKEAVLAVAQEKVMEMLKIGFKLEKEWKQ